MRKYKQTKVTKIKDRLFFILYENLGYYYDKNTNTITDRHGDTVSQQLQHKIKTIV